MIMVIEGLSNVGTSKWVSSGCGRGGGGGGSHLDNSGAEGLAFSSVDVSRPKVLACNFGQKKLTLVFLEDSFFYLIYKVVSGCVCLCVCLCVRYRNLHRWTYPHQIWHGRLTFQWPGHRLCFGPRGGLREVKNADIPIPPNILWGSHT